MGKIVTLDRDTVETLLQWAEAEGWNPGLDDSSLFFDADPEGYLGVMEGGELASAISVVKQNEHFAFLGLYLCKPEYRGRGLGWKVWQAGMERLAGMTVGLDGVVEQQGNYQKSGFQKAWRNKRFTGPVDYTARSSNDFELRGFEDQDLDTVVKLDLDTGGVERKHFLSHWLRPAASRQTMVALRGKKLCGVVTIRQCIEDFKIGPLFAEDSVVAKSLILSAAEKMKAGQIIIDVPEINVKANNLAQSMKLKPVFETARMYAGPIPRYSSETMYGVATLELG